MHKNPKYAVVIIIWNGKIIWCDAPFAIAATKTLNETKKVEKSVLWTNGFSSMFVFVEILIDF